MRMQGILFSKEECDLLWNLHQGNEWITSNAYNPETKEVTPNTKHQLRTECWINIDTPVDGTTTMKDIILSNVPWIKDDFDIGGTKLIQMDEGDFLHNHVDAGETKTLARRQYTMIIQLAEPDEYTGGDFYLGDYRLPKDKGFCCLFDGGTQYHEVKKVLSGTRKSWITWMPKESLTIF